MATKKFNLIPCTDSLYFYSNQPTSAIEQRCIGHLRMDFGDGEEFWTTWWPHTADAHNDEAFRAEFGKLAQQLRKNLFKSRRHMYKYLADHPVTPLENTCPYSYGYCVHTKRYSYFIRCMPERGDYNAYVYCYLKAEEEAPAENC